MNHTNLNILIVHYTMYLQTLMFLTLATVSWEPALYALSILTGTSIILEVVNTMMPSLYLRLSF